MKDDKKIIHLTLLRHGESTGNAQGVLQGQKDFALSPLGRQQVQWLSTRWVTEKTSFDLIISSPLSRASETAKIISPTLGASIEYDPDWMERDFGPYSGCVLDELTPDLSQNVSMDPSSPSGNDGESQMDFFRRAERATLSLLKRAHGRYLVVAHGGIINQALHAILGLPPQSGYSETRFILSNTGFATLSYDLSEHIWRLFRFNDRQHLDQRLAEHPNVEDENRSESNHQYQDNLHIKGSNSIPTQIRPARLADLDEILDVFIETDRMHTTARPDIFLPAQSTDWSRSFFETQFTQPGVFLFVAENNDRIFGCLHAILKESPQTEIWRHRRWLSISNISVRSSVRDQGIGKALMQSAHSLAIELGLHAIELTVWEFNTEALAFYKHLGYRTSRRAMWLEVK